MKHVFITGCPRSGTTMLANLIGSNRECKASPESDFFIDFVYKYFSVYSIYRYSCVPVFFVFY